MSKTRVWSLLAAKHNAQFNCCLKEKDDSNLIFLCCNFLSFHCRRKLGARLHHSSDSLLEWPGEVCHIVQVTEQKGK